MSDSSNCGGLYEPRIKRTASPRARALRTSLGAGRKVRHGQVQAHALRAPGLYTSRPAFNVAGARVGRFCRAHKEAGAPARPDSPNAARAACPSRRASVSRVDVQRELAIAPPLCVHLSGAGHSRAVGGARGSLAAALKVGARRLFLSFFKIKCVVCTLVRKSKYIIFIGRVFR